MDDYILWLVSTPGISNKMRFSLLSRFDTAENLYNSLNSINSDSSPMSKVISLLKQSKISGILEKTKNKMVKQGISFVNILDEDYPPLLRQIPDPPLGLFYSGRIKSDIPLVAVIGTRKHTEYGKLCAEKFSRELSENGVGIVSGMARGLDTIAHKAAVDSGGYTVAVLGCGLDICYPPENHELKNRIIQTGCVLSEYPLDEKPNKGNFQERNRIISGLSRAVLVVEASEKSGTSITVGHALEQGRDVFAVPGSIFSPQSKGSNEMIKEGAAIICSSDDILNELGISLTGRTTDTERIQFRENKYSSLDKEEKIVYDVISENPITIDELAYKTELSIQTIQYLLIQLELGGLIKKLPGQRYIQNQ